MAQKDPSSLVSVTDRPVTGGVVASNDHEGERNDVEQRVIDSNAMALALATMQSGASAPSFNNQGGVWFDTVNLVWQGNSSGSSYADTFATKLKAYSIDFATGAGSGAGQTFRLGGRLGTDTTTTTKAGNANTTFLSKTISANTLDHDGAYIYAFFGGTKSANNGLIPLNVLFGGTAIGLHSIPVVAATVSPWVIEAWVFRTGAATQKAFSVFYANRDDTGSTSLVVYNAGLAKTLSSDQTLALGVTAAGSASDNIVQEAMMWEYHG